MSLKIPSSGRKQFSSTMLLMQTPTSTTTAYVARKGDTLEKLATTVRLLHHNPQTPPSAHYPSNFNAPFPIINTSSLT